MSTCTCTSAHANADGVRQHSSLPSVDRTRCDALNGYVFTIRAPRSVVQLELDARTRCRNAGGIACNNGPVLLVAWFAGKRGRPITACPRINPLDVTLRAHYAGTLNIDVPHVGAVSLVLLDRCVACINADPTNAALDAECNSITCSFSMATLVPDDEHTAHCALSGAPPAAPTVLGKRSTSTRAVAAAADIVDVDADDALAAAYSPEYVAAMRTAGAISLEDRYHAQVEENNRLRQALAQSEARCAQRTAELKSSLRTSTYNAFRNTVLSCRQRLPDADDVIAMNDQIGAMDAAEFARVANLADFMGIDITEGALSLDTEQMWTLYDLVHGLMNPDLA